MIIGWPADLTWYKLLTDWGSFIGGGVALIAGVIAYAGARQAAAKQIKAMASRDQLRAHAIAVAIFSEILKLEITIQDSRKQLCQVKEQFSGNQPGQTISASVQQFGMIQIPPMLARNVDQLFLLGEVAGPACLQLVSLLFQYEILLQEIAGRMMFMGADTWAAEALQHLEAQLTLLDAVILRSASTKSARSTMM